MSVLAVNNWTSVDPPMDDSPVILGYHDRIRKQIKNLRNYQSSFDNYKRLIVEEEYKAGLGQLEPSGINDLKFKINEPVSIDKDELNLLQNRFKEAVGNRNLPLIVKTRSDILNLLRENLRKDQFEKIQKELGTNITTGLDKVQKDLNSGLEKVQNDVSSMNKTLRHHTPIGPAIDGLAATLKINKIEMNHTGLSYQSDHHTIKLFNSIDLIIDGSDFTIPGIIDIPEPIYTKSKDPNLYLQLLCSREPSRYGAIDDKDPTAYLNLFKKFPDTEKENLTRFLQRYLPDYVHNYTGDKSSAPLLGALIKLHKNANMRKSYKMLDFVKIDKSLIELKIVKPTGKGKEKDIKSDTSSSTGGKPIGGDGLTRSLPVKNTLNRFNIVYGSILAGNRRIELKQEAKQLALHLLDIHEISTHQYMDILHNLA